MLCYFQAKGPIKPRKETRWTGTGRIFKLYFFQWNRDNGKSPEEVLSSLSRVNGSCLLHRFNGCPKSASATWPLVTKWISGEPSNAMAVTSPSGSQWWDSLPFCSSLILQNGLLNSRMAVSFLWDFLCSFWPNHSKTSQPTVYHRSCVIEPFGILPGSSAKVCYNWIQRKHT